MASSYTLGAHYEGFVRELLASGRYSSASEIMRDGLRALEEREQVRALKLKELKAAIDDGFASGEAEVLDMEAIKSEARSSLTKPAHGA
ncbi:type II toxin-antitoxin system ParD family antitoxin [Rhizobium sp. 32-5/1]|uniref:type II toxin-antitoxin system ParD family antitoxin n=1 Tax=Rhizobium sp. 32-5/1 TaxID=3019602 RepID=UPI00240E5D99|nr:type II toxin-antitoxin system ParD family antitoxin [Rhizobium sp. 32-5/1]WEZ82883.1 type II toxin-antitoxin system ParD family antitoxin [Rhizobium sp. 32-5/1]